MASVNKVILVGNLGRDPDVRYTKSGAAVANFPIATNERWKNKETGNFEERTEWHRVVVWNRQAELCKEYLSKGRSVYIEGRLQTRQWDDKDGNKRYTTEVVAQLIQFLDRRGAANDGGDEAVAPSRADAVGQSATDGPPPLESDDDIPF